GNEGDPAFWSVEILWRLRVGKRRTIASVDDSRLIQECIHGEEALDAPVVRMVVCRRYHRKPYGSQISGQLGLAKQNVRAARPVGAESLQIEKGAFLVADCDVRGPHHVEELL